MTTSYSGLALAAGMMGMPEFFSGPGVKGNHGGTEARRWPFTLVRHTDLRVEFSFSF